MTYLTLEESKRHLNIDPDVTYDDDYITMLITLVEELVLAEIAGSKDGEGTVTTDGTDAFVGVETNFTDFAVGDTILVAGETIRIFKTIADDETAEVTVAFTNTGSGLEYKIYTGMPLVNGTIPSMLKHAMLLMIGHFYQIREPATLGVTVTKIPYGFEFLIAPFKNYTVV